MKKMDDIVAEIAPKVMAVLGDDCRAVFYHVPTDDIRAGMRRGEFTLLTRAQIEDSFHTRTNYLDVMLGMIAAGLSPEEIVQYLAVDGADAGPRRYFSTAPKRGLLTRATERYAAICDLRRATIDEDHFSQRPTFGAKRDATADIRFSIDALLKSRGVPQADGPAAACFWAGGTMGSWTPYVAYANGQLQPSGAPRARDESLSNVGEIITNSVKTLAILCDRNPGCGIVWRVRPEIGTESDGSLFWRARLAFVPVGDMTSLWLERPDCVDPQDGRGMLEKHEARILNTTLFGVGLARVGAAGDGVSLRSDEPRDFDMSKMRVVSRYLPSRTHDADIPGEIALPREHRFLVQQADAPCQECGAKYWDVAAGRLPDECPGPTPLGDGVALTSAAHPDGQANWPTIQMFDTTLAETGWRVAVPRGCGPFTLRYKGEPCTDGPWEFEPELRESALTTERVEYKGNGPFASLVHMPGWSADVHVTTESPVSGTTHVTAHVIGDTEALALAGAEWVLDAWAKDRETFIRAEPSAETQMDFASKEVIHTGHVRFTYGPNVGTRHGREKQADGEVRYLALPRLTDDYPVADFDTSKMIVRATERQPGIAPGIWAATSPVTNEPLKIVETHDLGCACERCDRRREGRKLFHDIFADATIQDMSPQCGLNLTSLETAKRLVGEPGILFAAQNLAGVVGTLEAAGGIGCKCTLVLDDIIGSPDAWALVSKDGKRAVIGMRDGR